MNLRKFIKIYNGALSDEFCDEVVSLFGAQAFNQTGPAGQPMGTDFLGNDGSHWTEMEIDDLDGWVQVKDELIHNCQYYTTKYASETGVDIPNRMMLEAFRIKHYKTADSDNFMQHVDADCFEKSVRYLVYIWYLSDVQKGGETKFTNTNLSVRSKKGRLLMFPPYWLFPHAGKAPVSHDKYIIGTFLNFPAPDEFSAG